MTADTAGGGGLTHAALCAFAPELLRQLRLQVLCQGIVSAAEAREMLEAASATLGAQPLFASQQPAPRCAELPTGVEVWVRQHPSRQSALQAKHANPNDTNSAIEVYLQVGIDERPRSMCVELLAQILHERASDQLRTKEQLGYIVWCGVRDDKGVCGLRVIIQSATHDPAALDARIEAYLATVPAELQRMGDDEFSAYRQALLDTKLEKDKTMRQEAGRYWGEIPSGTREFDRAERDVESLRQLTKAQLLDFWAEYIVAGCAKRRKLSSQVFAARHPLPPPPTTRPIWCLDDLDEIYEFKRALPTYPPSSSRKTREQLAQRAAEAPQGARDEAQQGARDGLPDWYAEMLAREAKQLVAGA